MITICDLLPGDLFYFKKLDEFAGKLDCLRLMIYVSDDRMGFKQFRITSYGACHLINTNVTPDGHVIRLEVVKLL